MSNGFFARQIHLVTTLFCTDNDEQSLHVDVGP